jgi:hypothetical protein
MRYNPFGKLHAACQGRRRNPHDPRKTAWLTGSIHGFWGKAFGAGILGTSEQIQAVVVIEGNADSAGYSVNFGFKPSQSLQDFF